MVSLPSAKWLALILALAYLAKAYLCYLLFRSRAIVYFMAFWMSISLWSCRVRKTQQIEVRYAMKI